MKVLLLIVGVIVIALFFMTRFNLWTFYISVLSILGVIVCANIFKFSHDLDRNTRIPFCKGNDFLNCTDVISIKLFGIIELVDLGIIYFVALFLFSIVSLVSTDISVARSLLKIPIAAALIFSIGCILYQLFVVKKACFWCLTIFLIICMQFAPYLMFRFLFNGDKAFAIDSILLFVLCVTVSGIWYIIKPLIVENYEIKSNNRLIYSFKSNGKVFETLLMGERKISWNKWEDEVFIGNNSAPCQIQVVYKPYCKFCSLVQQQIDNLLNVYPDQIGLSVRFKLADLNKTNKRTYTVNHILSAALKKSSEKRREILRDWFRYRNLNKLKAIWKISAAEFNNELLMKHYNWTNENNLSLTPMIYVNNFQLPSMYEIPDIEFYIKYLESKEKISVA